MYLLDLADTEVLVPKLLQQLFSYIDLQYSSLAWIPWSNANSRAGRISTCWLLVSVPDIAQKVLLHRKQVNCWQVDISKHRPGETTQFKLFFNNSPVLFVQLLHTCSKSVHIDYKIHLCFCVWFNCSPLKTSCKTMRSFGLKSQVDIFLFCHSWVQLLHLQYISFRSTHTEADSCISNTPLGIGGAAPSSLKMDWEQCVGLWTTTAHLCRGKLMQLQRVTLRLNNA